VDAPRVVIDTNVLVAALRSRRGASFRLFELIDSGKFHPCISVPLVLEYEAAAKDLIGQVPLRGRDVDAVIDYFCKVASHHQIYYLWRPFLKDAKDDMVLELAVTAACDAIVTYNVSHFEGAEQFGLKVMTAKELLQEIGVLK
jgi:putative PIN family toxin of toxin-antitoxin system